MNTKYYFTNDYTTKYGVVKKGDSLTGRLSTASSTPKVIFDFYEITDPVKAESGEGVFSINEVDLKNFASNVQLKTIDDAKGTQKGWKSYSKTKKGLVIGGIVLGVAGIVTAFLLFRKR